MSDGAKLMLECTAQVSNAACHPAEPIVACGLIDGAVNFFRYGSGSEVSRYRSVDAHRGSVRDVAFFGTEQFVSCSPDRAVKLWDLEAGRCVWEAEEAQSLGVCEVVRSDAGANGIIACGGEDGLISVYDVRKKGCIFSLADAHADFVSAFASGAPEKKNVLVATSADGCLSATDLRKHKVQGKSEDQEDELLSVTIMSGGKKVVCGTQMGPLHIFNFGRWGDCCDRFVGHPESVECLLPYDDDVLLSASSDGIIRVINISPNKLVGTVGHHDDFPVERLAITGDRAYLASTSHDEFVRLWDISFFDDDEEEEEEEEEEEKEGGGGKNPNHKK